MIAQSDTLFDMGEEVKQPELSWEDRMDKFVEIANGRGGLVPASALHHVLRVHRSRVHQLIQANQLEVVNYCGHAFVTGRSIQEHKDANRKSGRPTTKPTIWRQICLGAALGSAMADIIIPD